MMFTKTRLCWQKLPKQLILCRLEDRVYLMTLLLNTTPFRYLLLKFETSVVMVTSWPNKFDGIFSYQCAFACTFIFSLSHKSTKFQRSITLVPLYSDSGPPRMSFTSAPYLRPPKGQYKLSGPLVFKPWF